MDGCDAGLSFVWDARLSLQTGAVAVVVVVAGIALNSNLLHRFLTLTSSTSFAFSSSTTQPRPSTIATVSLLVHSFDDVATDEHSRGGRDFSSQLSLTVLFAGWSPFEIMTMFFRDVITADCEETGESAERKSSLNDDERVSGDAHAEVFAFRSRGVRRD